MSIALAFALQLATVAAQIPAEYLDQSRVMAEDSVVSGFFYSIGWEPDPQAHIWFETQLDALAASYGVAAGLARETLMAQALEKSRTLRERLMTRPGDAAERVRYLDDLQGWVQENCSAVALRRPMLFKGDVAANQARVDSNFTELRRQEAANPSPH